MSFPALNEYLQRLTAAAPAPGKIWINASGQAEGRFFNCTLSSAFRPIRVIEGLALAGYEALARGELPPNSSLSLWRMLDHAASDDESIELDRMCRMLHSINFFRQPEAEGADLYLSVHNRLLSAVSSNHGYAFRRIMAALELPVGQVVLQLPAVSAARRWQLNFVADNYRRNGFRVAYNVQTLAEATEVLAQVRPYAVKIDAGTLDPHTDLEHLMALAHAGSAKLIFKRVESQAMLERLARASANCGVPVMAQGCLLDLPHTALGQERGVGQQTEAPMV